MASMVPGLTEMSIVMVFDMFLKFPSIERWDEVEGEWVRPSLVALEVSGGSSSLRGGRTDDRWWLSPLGLSLSAIASMIASSDNKTSFRKSCDEEDGIAAHLGKEYGSNSSSVGGQMWDTDSDYIAEYVFSAGDNSIVSPYCSTSVGDGSIHGPPMNVPIEEIMLIGATNTSGIGGGNIPIRQGSLKSPALISSGTTCELTNGTLAAASNQTLGE